MSKVKFDKDLLKQVKQAFVPMPGGQAEPVAGASAMTAGMAAPMGGDPAAGGMPMDPAMAGGMPMDPSMDPAAAGGMPMDPSMMGMDPSMAGGLPPELAGLEGAGGSAGGQIVMSSAEFLELLVTLITTLNGGGGSKAKPNGGGGMDAGKSGGTSAKLDQILELLSGQPAAPQM